MERAIDAYLVERFGARFVAPMRFQGAAGVERRALPREEDFPDEAAYSAADAAYWEAFGPPDPWTEVTFPGQVLRPCGHDREPFAVETPRQLLGEVLSWSINDKRYPIQRADGSRAEVAYSFEPAEAAQIAHLEDEHRRARSALIDLFLSGLGPTTRFFYTVHALAPESSEARLWELFLDEVVVAVDEEHLRVAWAGHDRYYG